VRLVHAFLEVAAESLPVDRARSPKRKGRAPPPLDPARPCHLWVIGLSVTLNSPHPSGINVPVEAPSTAAKPDFSCSARVAVLQIWGQVARDLAAHDRNPSSSCESVIHSNPLATSHSGTQRSVCLKGLPRHTCSVAHWPTNLHAETEL
jgi:hypothetical protein